MALRQLTDLQQKFVKYYLETNDVGQAIRLAGYSPSDAKQRGRLLLRKSHVRAAIAEARKEAGIYAALSLEDILEGLYKEAKFITTSIDFDWNRELGRAQVRDESGHLET